MNLIWLKVYGPVLVSERMIEQFYQSLDGDAANKTNNEVGYAWASQETFLTICSNFCLRMDHPNFTCMMLYLKATECLKRANR